MYWDSWRSFKLAVGRQSVGDATESIPSGPDVLCVIILSRHGLYAQDIRTSLADDNPGSRQLATHVPFDRAFRDVRFGVNAAPT